MDKRSEISEHEAEELIKGMGRIATVVVHDDGLVTATAISTIASNPRIQNEVDEFLREIQRKYRIVKRQIKIRNPQHIRTE
jgi:hypothetical protein